MVRCGATITADTTLHHDLLDCPGNGIVIGADHITLDLNGHTVDGAGSGAALVRLVRHVTRAVLRNVAIRGPGR